MAVSIDSPSVQTHLSILQGIVNRAATNSANCKTWCTTLVAAILVLVLDQECASGAFLGALPIGLFLYLDAYYLSLETDFRSAYEDVVDRIHSGTFSDAEVLVIRPVRGTGHRAVGVLRAMKSASVYPFYGLMLIAILATYVAFR